jgi:hypothetical protein
LFGIAEKGVRMIQPKPSRLHLVDEFFMGTSGVHETVDRLAKLLSQMNLPFVVSGALAVNHYGHLRATTYVDLLMRKEDLKTFKDKYIGLGWLNKFEGSKGFRDTVTNTPVDVLITGDYPGDGKPKPISFPDPVDVAEFDNSGIPCIRLSSLVELKLASGMTAPDRPRDFDDVIQLIRKNNLDLVYGESLDPYVRDSWTRLWHASQHKDEY